jgi:hypothetical protein
MRKMYEVEADKLVPGQIYYNSMHSRISVRFVKLEGDTVWMKRIKGTEWAFLEASNGLIPFILAPWYSFKKH